MCFRPTGVVVDVNCPYCGKKLPTFGTLKKCPFCKEVFTEGDLDNLKAVFEGKAPSGSLDGPSPMAPGARQAPPVPAAPKAPPAPAIPR